MKAKARCLTCGHVAVLIRSRCHACHRNKRNARYPGRAWQQQSADAITAHIAQHGLVCPGWRRPSHAVATRADLTLDHETGVLCRVCNSAKRDRG